MKIDIPDYNVPFLQPDGRLINPIWYEKLKLLFEKRSLGDLVDVDVSGLANGETIIWNATDGVWEDGAN